MVSRVNNHDPDQILRPRPVKPLNPDVLRTQNLGDQLEVQDQSLSGISRFVAPKSRLLVANVK